MSDRADSRRLWGEPSRVSEPAQVVVCEQSGHWAAALRPLLESDGIRLRQTRSLVDAWAVLAESPASLLVVEATAANLAELVERMAALEVQYPAARVAALVSRPFAQSEALLREAGAVHVAVAARELAPLAGVIRRHLAALPRPRLSLAEHVWASLPWAPALPSPASPTTPARRAP